MASPRRRKFLRLWAEEKKAADTVVETVVPVVEAPVEKKTVKTTNTANKTKKTKKVTKTTNDA